MVLRIVFDRAHPAHAARVSGPDTRREKRRLGIIVASRVLLHRRLGALVWRRGSRPASMTPANSGAVPACAEGLDPVKPCRLVPTAFGRRFAGRRRTAAVPAEVVAETGWAIRLVDVVLEVLRSSTLQTAAQAEHASTGSPASFPGEERVPRTTGSASAPRRHSGWRTAGAFSANDSRPDRLPGKRCRLMMGAHDRFAAGLPSEHQGERT